MVPSVLMTRSETRPAAEIAIECERTSNHVPEDFGTLDLDDAARQAYVAWGPGALGVATRMADDLNADLLAGSVSRQIYDCLRPPDVPSAFPAKSQVIDVPCNHDLRLAQKTARTRAVKEPFRLALSSLMQKRGRACL